MLHLNRIKKGLTLFNFKCLTTHVSNELEFSLRNDKIVNYLENIKNEFYVLRTSSKLNKNDQYRIRQLSKIVDTYEKRNCIKSNLSAINDMKNEKDEDMKELIKEEKEIYSNMLNKLDTDLIKELLQISDEKQYDAVIFEINAGAGGQEAMIFANELLEMYTSFIFSKGGDIELLQKDESDIGGLRYVSCIIECKNVYNLLKNEAGVHRVQRVPATEKSGRMHTSTVSVTLVPRSEDDKIEINDKSLKIETKRSSGAGGQHVNTTDSAVRIVHIPTGTIVECQTERSQIKNKEIAIKKLENILIQRQFQAKEASTSAIRKAQMGTKNRNEKIRTYNFTQDRITDHRLKNGTFHNIKEFLNGGEPLNELISELSNNDRKIKLLQLIEPEQS